MNDLERKILEYGRKREISALQKLINSTNKNEIADLIKNRLNNSNFGNIWDYLLKSFQDTSICHETRLYIILEFLKELENRDSLHSHQSRSLVQRICMELMKFKTDHLIKICNYCLDSIRSNEIRTNSCWKDLLPETLRILSERDQVNYNELEYTGQEFKTNCINNLCMSNWSPSLITSMTEMFIDMPLNKDEHLKVVNKLSTYIDKLTPQEVPPFVYQLLKFCQNQNARAVFLKLQNYFGLRIYSNERKFSDDSPDLDSIDDAEDHDALEAESTVLFHIQSAASIGHNCIKDYILSLKNAVKSANFILQPFQLLTLLTISTVQQYEETAFDIIRHSIVRSYNEQQKRLSSRWYREIIHSSVNAEDVFKQIINLGQMQTSVMSAKSHFFGLIERLIIAFSISEREFLLEALVNFGFVLLSVGSALGRDVIAEKQWSLGTLILLKIIKRKRHVTSVILKTFCNHIVTRQNATQYIECLYILCKTSPLLMLENQSCIGELMESLIQINGNVANQLLEALIPLTKVSPTIRDQFILILRKALYSRSIETRKLAVNGFVKLLTTLRISGGGVLSQNSSGSFSSGYSLYTQISLNRSSQTIGSSNYSNEAICWEVLGILKRCFIQQAEVRGKLYEDLFDAVCTNPELGIPVLDVLWFHFVEYYVMDEETNPPLNFSKVTDLRDTESVLLEPLGKFIFTISQIIVKVCQSEDDRDNPTVVKYVEIMDSLCNRMKICELVHFELDDGTDLTNILPESQQKMHILKEVINVYEALVGYKISTLESGKENQCRIIYDLYQGYSRFSHFGKSLSKPKKIKKNDKMSQKEDVRQSQKTAKDTQTQSITARKIDNASKSQTKTFRIPDTLLDFGTVDKGLKTLLEPSVPWVIISDANTIKTKTEMHRHFVHAALHLIGKMKNRGAVDSQYQKNYYDHITSITSTLYNRIIKRLEEYVDFDCITAVSSVEYFYSVLHLVNNQFKTNLVNFLSKVGGEDKEAALISHLKAIIEEFQKLFEKDEEELSNDPEIKKLPLMVINVLCVLCSFIPEGSNVLSVQVYDWLKHYAFNNTVSSKVSGIFVNLLFDCHVRYQDGLTLFERISVSLKSVMNVIEDETLEENDDVKIVDIHTSHSIIQALCSHVKNILDDIDSMLARIKSDYFILTYLGQDNVDELRINLRLKEKGVCCQLSFVVDIVINVANVAIPPGSISDAVFKNIMQLYSTLSSLTKHFMSRSSKNDVAFQGIWFERVVKKAGKRLASLVYRLIMHVEGYHNKDENPTQSKKKSLEGQSMKSKVLRETKIIPKVIYEIEQFSKGIIQLTKKTKFDLSKYVGQGTVRDFRILKPALEQVLHDEPNTTNESQSTLNETVEDVAEEDQEETNNDESVISSDENEIPESPPSKKSKR